MNFSAKPLTLFRRNWCASLVVGLLQAVAAGAFAQTSTPADLKLVVMEAVESAPELVTLEVADRFKAEPASVESRLKGSFLANLEQQLISSSKLRLAVRGEALGRLMREWKVAEELGSGRAGASEAGPSVDEGDYIAVAKLEDFGADRETLNRGGKTVAARWSMQLAASLTITEVKTGQKVLAVVEKVNLADKGRGAVDFNSRDIQAVNAVLANKLAARVLDTLCPPKILSVRGRRFIIDRGEAAGVKVGDEFTLLEPVQGGGADAAFPVGTAVVEFVNERSANLILAKESDSGVEIRTDFTVFRKK